MISITGNESLTLASVILLPWRKIQPMLTATRRDVREGTRVSQAACFEAFMKDWELMKRYCSYRICKSRSQLLMLKTTETEREFQLAFRNLHHIAEHLPLLTFCPDVSRRTKTATILLDTREPRHIGVTTFSCTLITRKSLPGPKCAFTYFATFARTRGDCK